MEDIKTNFDKIIEQFSDSISHSFPKKLNFDHLNDSLETSIHKKRKLSPEKNDLNSSKHTEENSDKNASRESLNSSVVSSPWEVRLIRADLLEARTRIRKLKQEVEQQHTARANVEILYNNKISSLQKQCDYTSNKVLDMEKHLAALRKRENAAKAELVKVKNQMNQQKQSYDEKLFDLQRANSEIEESSRVLQTKLSNELSEYKRRSDKLKMELDMANQELESLKGMHAVYREKAASYDDLKAELEAEKQQHDLTKSKVKELQYELESYGEWKELSKTTHGRLSSLPDLEKEVKRLRVENKNLHDSIGNKLLLEEQVFDLQSRLEKYEKLNTDTITLTVQITTLEKEISEWRQIAEDHCLPNTAINPISLRSRIEQILQNDLILTSESGSAQNEKDASQSQLQELQSQIEIYLKANNDLKTNLKHHKNIMSRVQKKLILVAKERDCYKQLLENFEKDLTISGALADTINPDSQLRARLEMLEKTLNGYKEMCANLEKELALCKQNADAPLEIPINTDCYDSLKKEMDTLRMENERLQRRKLELELQVEQRCIKGDYPNNDIKILHMSMNPAAEAYEIKNDIEKLKAEIERLRRKNRKLEKDHEDMTTRLNETANLTVNLKEVNCLRAKLESMEAKMQHMKEVYKSASLEFREVVYLLFGYRVDRVGNANYRISSMYAESEDDYLNFRLNESGILDMLETDYSVSLGDMVRTYLVAHKSLPAFLCALTLELFNRTTMMA